VNPRLLSLALLLVVPIAPRIGPACASEWVAVTVHSGRILGVIHKAVLGVNSDTRYDDASALRTLSRTFATIGMAGSRWPGGNAADVLDWQGPIRYCDWWSNQPVASDGTFDAYMNTLVLPNNLSPELTVNYATSGSPACAEAGDPKHAAAWVAYANVAKRYGVKWWEVGNEVYERVEPDNHREPHTPQSYAAFEPAFYSAMKAEDPTINVGIPITGGSHNVPNWDAYVLANARYDYVVYHYYPTFYPSISDAALLAAPIRGSFAVSRIMKNIRSLLASAGKCVSPCSSFPISISEWNSVSHLPTPQTLSIVEGLFVAETLGEFFNAGVARAEFWDDNNCEVNTSKSGYKAQLPAPVYGWQQGVGGLGISSASGIPGPVMCRWGASFSAPPGTIFPSGRAFQLYAQSGFASDGSSALSVDDSSSTVRSYASYNPAMHQYVVVVINLDGGSSAQAKLSIDGVGGGGEYQTIQYSKDIYDDTKDNGPWAPPISRSFGFWRFPLDVSVPPWSMTAYTFKTGQS